LLITVIRFDLSFDAKYVLYSADKNNRKFWEELIAYFPLILHGPHRKLKIRGIHRHTDGQREIHREQGDLISLLVLFQSKANSLKIKFTQKLFVQISKFNLNA
jgi:hypothetical protein